MQIREDILVEIEALLDDLVAEIEMQKEEGQISDTAASSLLDLLGEISRKLKQAQEDNASEKEIALKQDEPDTVEQGEGQQAQTTLQTTQQEEQQHTAEEQMKEQNQDLTEEVEVIKIDDGSDNVDHAEEQKEKHSTQDKTITY